jgi:hypothetical protein
MSHNSDMLDKEFYPEAKSLAKQHTKDFAVSLLLQAKLVAFSQKADCVLRSHADEARNIVLDVRKQAWAQKLRIVLGGALLDIFVQGCISEIYLPTPRPLWIAIYTTIGFVGLFLVL